MELSEDQAQELVDLITRRLKELHATEVLNGIEASRLQGIEEKLDLRSAGPLEFRLPKEDLKTLGNTRRRPPSSSEVLTLVLERLEQRLVIVPALARSIQDRVGAEIVWKVDQEYASPDTLADVSVRSLRPDEASKVSELFGQVLRLVPRAAPKRDRSINDG